MFLQNRASFLGRPALDRRQGPVAPNSHPVDRRPFVGRNSASASRSPPRRSASSMSRFWSSPFSSRGCPGTAPLCAARCPASLVKVVLARYGRPSRAAFPVAGAKADAGWNGFLPLGRARSAAETRATHSAQLAASFDRCRDAHAAIPPGLCAIFTLCCRLCSRLLRAPSLAQECVQRSLLVLSGYAATTGIKAEKTRTESYF